MMLLVVLQVATLTQGFQVGRIAVPRIVVQMRDREDNHNPAVTLGIAFALAVGHAGHLSSLAVGDPLERWPSQPVARAVTWSVAGDPPEVAIAVAIAHGIVPEPAFFAAVVCPLAHLATDLAPVGRVERSVFRPDWHG